MNESKMNWVKVTSPDADGTINLFWGDYSIQWIDDLKVAREIMKCYPESKVDEP